MNIKRLFLALFFIVVADLAHCVEQNLCPIDFSTPTTAQNVQARIEQVTKYRDFAQEQIISIIPVLQVNHNEGGNIVKAGFIKLISEFQNTLQHYADNNFRVGDLYLSIGLARGFHTIEDIIKYRKEQNETTTQEEINNVKGALIDYEGSPLYYPKAQENFDLIPTFLITDHGLEEWIIDIGPHI